MIAEVNLVGVAAVITSVATLAAVLVNSVVVLRTHRRVTSIDQAVNTRPPGSQTISEQVQALADRLPAQDAAAAEVLRRRDQD